MKFGAISDLGQVARFWIRVGKSKRRLLTLDEVKKTLKKSGADLPKVGVVEVLAQEGAIAWAGPRCEDGSRHLHEHVLDFCPCFVARIR